MREIFTCLNRINIAAIHGIKKLTTFKCLLATIYEVSMEHLPAATPAVNAKHSMKSEKYT